MRIILASKKLKYIGKPLVMFFGFNFAKTFFIIFYRKVCKIKGKMKTAKKMIFKDRLACQITLCY